MRRKKTTRIKSILAALLAVVISAGAFCVPAFAYTGEDSEPTVQDAVPVSSEDTDTDEQEDDDPIVTPEDAEEAEGSTVHIRTENGTIIFSFDDEEDGEETRQIGIVTTNGGRLNVRSGGGMDCEILDQLLPGEQVEVIEDEGDWVKIIVPEKTGYVYKEYLRIIEQNQSGSTGIDIPEEYLTLFLQMLSGQSSSGSLPLTPDGNLTLVDDVGSPTGEGKQFITMVTRSGNYFYLVIDRDEKGNENVHFLNQVDEADLFSLMDEDAAAAMKEQLAAQESEKQQEQQTVTPTETPDTEKDKEQEPEPEQKSKAPYVLGLILLLGICGVGGAFFFMKNKKQQTAVTDSPDPDADYREDDDGYDIPEEAEDEEDYDESEDE